MNLGGLPELILAIFFRIALEAAINIAPRIRDAPCKMQTIFVDAAEGGFAVNHF